MTRKARKTSKSVGRKTMKRTRGGAGGVPGNPLTAGGVPGSPWAAGGVPGSPLAAGGVPGSPLAAGGVPGLPRPKLS